jgi:uncharacterized protein YkwD
MKKITFMLLVAFLVSSCDGLTDAITPANQNEVVKLVNEWRTKGCQCGSTQMPPVGTVVAQTQLDEAALKHSQDMERQNYFSHTGKNGSNPGQRITATGYQWQTYGENIAQGYTTEQAVVEAWIKSEGHCRNIMNGNFKEMGIGKSGSYWTQVFATPK